MTAGTARDNDGPLSCTPVWCDKTQCLESSRFEGKIITNKENQMADEPVRLTQMVEASG